MVALRMPVLQIPLDDEAFKKFAQLFGEYQDRLEKSPGLWRKTNEAIFSQGHALRQLGENKGATSMWRSIAGFSGSALSATLGITREILKWGTLLGGGLIGGSLFGITRMAGDVSSYRQRAMGLGMSIGGMRSFDVNFKRLGDPGGFLSAINAAISNPSLQGPLYALGVNPDGSTGQVSVAMLKAMRRLALSTPRGELGLMSDAYGLGPYGGLEKLMILKAMGNKEFASLLAGNTADKGPLGISKQTSLAWQKFTTQMELAGGEIFTVFVKGLAPLAGPLSKLSVAFTGFLTRLMSGPLLKQGVDKLADWLNKFSVEMTSKKFQAAVSTLVSDTGKIAAALHWIVGEIAFIRHPLSETAQAWRGAMKPSYPIHIGRGGGPANWIGGAAQFSAAADKLDAMFGFPAGTMRRLIGTESSFNPGAVSPKGAEGLGQLMPRTAMAYGLYGNEVFNPSANMSASAAYLSNLARRYNGNMQEALAAYNWGPGNVDRIVGRYGSRWRGHLPRGVNSYVTAISPDPHISVSVKSKTGASAVLAGAGLAAVPGT